MKRIYMALALVTGLALGAHAQKSLKVEFVRPTANQAFANNADSIIYQFKITNNGPDSIIASKGDSLHIMLDIKYFGCILQNIKFLEIVAGVNIPPNKFINVNWTEKTNSQFWNDPDAPKTSINQDATMCPKVGVFGVTTNAEGSFYFAGNPGADPDLLNDAFVNATTQAELGDMLVQALSGDNLATVSVKFGTGANNLCNTTGIIDFNGIDKTGLNIYPNPASSEVRFKHTIAGNDHATVRVMDITGRQLLTKDFGKQNAGEKEFLLDVSSLQNGIYYLELITDNARGISKMTIKK